MQIRNLTDLFVHELLDIHNAEKQLLEVLPKMADRARDDHLKKTISEHYQETQRHVTRIQEILDILGLTVKADHECRAMKGLIEETQAILSDAADNRANDAAIIAGTQKIEHYEIASYGTLIAVARTLGYDNAVVILKQTLDEEKKADETLTQIAVDEGLNKQARKAA